MDHPQKNQHGNIPHPSVNVGTVPNDSEPFSSVLNAAEEFRSVPQISERKESHTLTVREAARIFEAAGVARTERSIVNWCQPNRTGIARLDSYFDPNERRYYISLQSVELAIAEEKAKAAKKNETSEPIGSNSNSAKSLKNSNAPAVDESLIKELQRENLDLKIASRGKDYLIEQMQNERVGFIEQLVATNRKVGELETRLLQIHPPKLN